MNDGSPLPILLLIIACAGISVWAVREIMRPENLLYFVSVLTFC